MPVGDEIRGRMKLCPQCGREMRSVIGFPPPGPPWQCSVCGLNLLGAFGRVEYWERNNHGGRLLFHWGSEDLVVWDERGL